MESLFSAKLVLNFSCPALFLFCVLSMFIICLVFVVYWVLDFFEVSFISAILYFLVNCVALICQLSLISANSNILFSQNLHQLVVINFWIRSKKKKKFEIENKRVKKKWKKEREKIWIKKTTAYLIKFLSVFLSLVQSISICHHIIESSVCTLVCPWRIY